MIQLTPDMLSIIDAVPDALVVINSEGIITYFNKQAETLFGYSREEILNNNVEKLMPARFRHHHTTLRLQYFERPHVRPPLGEGLDLFGLKKDDSEFPVEISLSPLHTGTELLALASIRDITERKKSEAKFKGILEAMPNALVISNQTGKIIFINSQTELLFGFNHSELIDKPIELLIPERFLERHSRQMVKFSEHPHVRHMDAELDLHGKKKDGSEFPIDMNLSPLESEEGLWILATIQDITERKHIEQNLHENNLLLQNMMTQLQQQTTQRLRFEKELARYRLSEQKARVRVAEQYREIQEEFINTICHEIRNPLNVIYGDVDLLNERMQVINNLLHDEGDALKKSTYSLLMEQLDKCQEDIAAIKECSQQQKLIVDDVLDFSKLDSNKIELNPIVFNLQEVIHTHLRMFKPQLREKNVKLYVDMPEGKLWLKADVYRLKQIMSNLLSNAIKFTHKGYINVIVHLNLYLL